MITVGKLSKRFGISRTALLYYDQIGLISPSSRSESGYRLYSDNDVARLEQIIVLKSAGVPLREISRLLETEEPQIFGALLKRLGELNAEIGQRKECQHRIISLLNRPSTTAHAKECHPMEFINEIADYAGIEPNQRDEWHNEFSRQSPEQHEFLLSVLGLSKPV